MNWIIYYSDDTYHGPVASAPALDVQAIVVANGDVGWAMVHSADYYIWDNDTWRGVDIFGLWDYLARPGMKRALFGRTLPNAEWQAVYERVKADAIFGRKAGYLPQERKP